MDEFKLGTIFGEDDYKNAFNYASKNNYTIEEIEPETEVDKTKSQLKNIDESELDLEAETNTEPKLEEIETEVVHRRFKIVEMTSYEPTEEEALNAELRQINEWFTNVYDNQIKQSQRCARLGIEYDNKYGTIEELDAEAEVKALRIREIIKIY